MGAESTAPAAGERRLDALALALSALAVLSALAAADVLPRAVLGPCAASALCASSALPLCARILPRPADPLALLAGTLALSPSFAAAVWGAWHLALDTRGALVACALTCAVLHLGALRCRMSPPRRVLAFAALPALALGVLAALCLLRGDAPRLAEPAAVRAAVALAIDRAVPPGNPWLAGEAWTRAWGAELVAAFGARALSVAPSLA